MNDLIPNSKNEQLTMSSREIANLTGKRHGDVLRDIRALLRSTKYSPLDIKIDGRGYTAEILLCNESSKLLLKKYEGLARAPLQMKEDTALAAIEQVLGVTLRRQYRVGRYRIDGYDHENNVAYEIDEEHHRYQREQDKRRQKYIEERLGCRFIRVEV